MAVGKEIRTKIRSIKNTQKITKAMEMVAASKKRKAQDRMHRAQPYAKKILQVLGHVAKSHPEYKHDFLQHREIKRVGYIIVTTDRGLCGGLNAALLKATILHIREWQSKSVDVNLCLIGAKADAFFKRVGGKVLAQGNHLGDAPSVESLIGMVKVMLDAYRNHQIDALYLCSNHFINTMKQEPVIQQLLPVVPSTNEKLGHHWDYIYEPDNAAYLLDALLSRYIESQVYRGVIENIACEQAARMIAMKNATENAADLIHELQMVYNKARQASITQELTEIVAGAAVV
ncbi:MAG TPA: F0F1 ATP synthase subunit gamma [Gammaproteobacteria bacterium]|nr:F0F1 ATP synthase subunit gamma [Gammaproteobacteria bacterium]